MFEIPSSSSVLYIMAQDSEDPSSDDGSSSSDESESGTKCLTDYSCVLNNREKWKIDCTQLVSKNVEKLVLKDDKHIALIAIGPNDYFAVICTDGTTRYHGPKEFNLEMQEIDAKEIKCISFGGDDHYAITMKNGKAHHSFPSRLLTACNLINHYTYILTHI